jgi:hypothetical protein
MRKSINDVELKLRHRRNVWSGGSGGSGCAP